jgi:hypothetical protein
MLAHADDFRSEVPGEEGAQVARALLEDWRTAPLREPDRALCEFAEKLTRRPGEMEEDDIEALRAHGFDDLSIHDAVQSIAYFNYINRVADGLGVDLEPDMPPPRRPGAEPGDTEIAIFAAGEALAPSTDTGSMTIVWRCMKCNHHFKAGDELPESCPSCGAPRTEFQLVEED